MMSCLHVHLCLRTSSVCVHCLCKVLSQQQADLLRSEPKYTNTLPTSTGTLSAELLHSGACFHRCARFRCLPWILCSSQVLKRIAAAAQEHSHLPQRALGYDVKYNDTSISTTSCNLFLRIASLSSTKQFPGRKTAPLLHNKN